MPEAIRRLKFVDGQWKVVLMDTATGATVPVNTPGYTIYSNDVPRGGAFPTTTPTPVTPTTPTGPVTPAPNGNSNNDPLPSLSPEPKDEDYNSYLPLQWKEGNSFKPTLGPVGMDDIAKYTGLDKVGDNITAAVSPIAKQAGDAIRGGVGGLVDKAKTWFMGTPIGQKIVQAEVAKQMPGIQAQAGAAISNVGTNVGSAVAGIGQNIGDMFGGMFGGGNSPQTNMAANGDVPVTYNNQAAVRNDPIMQQLISNLQMGVRAVYGPGYRVEIASGGQNPDDIAAGEEQKGSYRHTTLAAADVRIYDPSGKELRGDALVPIAQHWLASNIGSVGLPGVNSGNWLHLDLIGGQGPGNQPLQGGKRFWIYDETDADKPAISALSDAINNGVYPQYANLPIDPMDNRPKEGSDVGNQFNDPAVQQTEQAMNNSVNDLGQPQFDRLGDTNQPANIPQDRINNQQQFDPMQRNQDTNMNSMPQQQPTPQEDLIGPLPSEQQQPEIANNEPFPNDPLAAIDQAMGITPEVTDPTLDPIKMAYLALINSSEGSPNYNQTFGYGAIEDLSRFPDFYNAEHNTSASGAYQINKITYNDYAPKLGISDFSPDSQDKLAWAIAETNYKTVTGGDLYEDLASGDPSKIKQAIVGNKNRWVSLPGGTNPKYSIDDSISMFAEWVNSSTAQNLGLRDKTELELKDLGVPVGNTQLEQAMMPQNQNPDPLGQNRTTAQQNTNQQTRQYTDEERQNGVSSSDYYAPDGYVSSGSNDSGDVSSSGSNSYEWNNTPTRNASNSTRNSLPSSNNSGFSSNNQTSNTNRENRNSMPASGTKTSASSNVRAGMSSNNNVSKGSSNNNNIVSRQQSNKQEEDKNKNKWW